MARYTDYVVCITGEPVLLQAFIAKCKDLGWDTRDCWNVDEDHFLKVYWRPTGERSGITTVHRRQADLNDRTFNIHYQWDEASKAVMGDWDVAASVLYYEGRYM
jgi:hypothetical protein